MCYVDYFKVLSSYLVMLFLFVRLRTQFACLSLSFYVQLDIYGKNQQSSSYSTNDILTKGKRFFFFCMIQPFIPIARLVQ